MDDNINLYRNINLGYDPYKEEDIDKRGKSYLKINYNEYVDIPDLRKRKKQQIFNHEMNDNIVNPIHKKTKLITIMGAITCGCGSFLYLLYLCYPYQSHYPGCTKFSIKFYICGNLIFLGLIITPLIFGCINIKKASKGEDMDSNNNFSYFKNINIVFIIIGFILVALLIIYLIQLQLKCEFNKNIEKEKENNNNKTNSTLNEQMNRAKQINQNIKVFETEANINNDNDDKKE